MRIRVGKTEIITNKSLQSICDNRVSFRDGSYFDLASGDLVTQGRGYIKVVNWDSGNNPTEDDQYVEVAGGSTPSIWGFVGTIVILLIVILMLANLIYTFFT